MKQKQKKQKKKLISWILLLAWMAFIFYMSQQTGQVSSGQSGKIVLLLSKIGIEISKDNISNITEVLNKFAEGNFDVEIEDNYIGEFIEIKERALTLQKF